MSNSIWQILIVEREPNKLHSICQVTSAEYEHQAVLTQARLGAEGIQMIAARKDDPFDCILLDGDLLDMTPSQFLNAIKKQSGIQSPIVIASAGAAYPCIGLIREGAQDCIEKSTLTAQGLNWAILNAIERFNLVRECRTKERALRLSEEKFRSLLEAAPDAVLIADSLNKITIVNSQTEKLFGYSREELLGRSLGLVIYDRRPIPIEHGSTDQEISPESTNVEFPDDLIGIRKDRTEFPIEMSLSSMESTEGKLTYHSIRDVSERKHLERILRHKDDRLQFVMDSIPQKIGTSQSNGAVDYFNPQWSEYTGISIESLKAWGWQKAIHPDDLSEHVRAWQHSIDTGIPFEWESRFRRADGEYRWHFSRALPMRDESGRIVMWVGSNTDIQDIRQVEATILDSEIRYRRLFEAAHDGILIVDAISRKITHVNPFLTNLLAYPSEHFVGKELWEIGFLQDKSASQAAMQQLDKQGVIRYESLPLEDRHGQLHPVEMVANKYDEGQHPVIQCNIRDISERKRLEKQLQDQASELSDLHRRKDEFLAMLSHELRSPLAPIANALQLLGLQQQRESPLQTQAREIIERQVGNLQHLVDDLLEVSRITTGRVQLRREVVSIDGIVRCGLETARPIIEQRRHKLIVSVPHDPIWLFADSARLEQVVVNLLTNAAKYTEESGMIWLSVGVEDNECVLRVRDNGVGINPTLLPRIFDLFTQAERSLDRSQGGLGIGLALVQSLTELHGGNVEVHSEVGRGSEFVVRLPIEEKANTTSVPSLEPATADTSKELKVLVVDDNLDTALSFTILLRSLGYKVRTAHDGVSALEVAAAFIPDVMLLDIGLPGLSGYEVAKRIRQDAQLKGVVLIALTGYGQEVDRQTSAEAGFDHHLVKPAKFEQLQSILCSVRKG